VSPDLIVIGAGPAGLAVAIAAARNRIDTLVIERRQLPIDKACGEGLLPNGVDALGRLDVPLATLRRSAATLVGIRYITAAGRTASSLFPSGVGLGLRRECLSQALAARAREESSLELRSGVQADVQMGSGGPLVTVGRTTWRPRLVIGADGLRSQVRQACGIVSDLARRRRWGVRQHFSGEPWSDHVEVYFGRGFEAYVTPVAGGVNVAWLWEQGAVELAGVPGTNVCQMFLPRIPALAARLEGRRATDRPQAAGPFQHQPRERARDGVLLVGDAAGYLDPLTGEGVGLALAQSELFEQHVVPVLVARRHQVLPASAFGSYLRAVDVASKPNRDLTRLMLSMAGKPAIIERVVTALSRDPRLFQHCLDANMGRRPFWPPPIASLLKLPVAVAIGG